MLRAIPLQIGDLGLAFWITIVVAVIAIIIPTVAAAYFYRKSWRIKQLSYAVTTANLIQDYSSKLTGLKIEYKGKNPSNISISKIMVWNNGNETINRADIAEGDPLRILINSEVLDASVIGVTGPGNRFALTPGLQVSFDYLDKDDGGIIQLVHTGTPATTIIFYGRIKGSGMPVGLQFGPNKTLAKIGSWLSGAGLIIALPIFVGFLIFGYSILIYISMAIFFVLILSSLIVGLIARRYPIIPKKFESARVAA